MSSENDPRYSILVGGLGFGDAYFDNGGVLPAEGGIAPFAVTSTGQLTTYSAIDQAAVEATVTYPGAEHSAQIWGVTLMGAIVTESTIGGQTYTEVSHQPLNLSSGGLLLTSASFAGSTGSAVPTTAAFIAGTDGTDLQGLSVSSAGVLNVSDGTSHTALSSILTQLDQFEFDGSGNLKVNVEVDAGGSDPSVGVIGDTAPLSAIFIGATDGTNLQGVGITGGDGGSLNVFDASFQEALQEDSITTTSGLPILAITPTPDTWAALLVDASGYLKVNVAAGGAGGGAVWGPNASGAAPSEDPVLNAGWDGTDVRTLLTDTSGQLKILVENSPTVSISGSVAVTGTFYQATQPVSLASAVTVVGDAANGSAVAGNPVLVAGSDGTDARTLSTDTSGRQLIQHPNNALLATTAESVTSTVTTLSETASVSGQCVVVSVSCVAAKTMAYPVAVRVRDTTNGISTGWQLCPIQVAGGNASQLYFNLPVTNGDTVDIDLIAQGTVGSGATNVAVVLSPFSIPTALRPDGRSLPLGTLAKSVELSASSGGTIVAAPASGFRILLSTAYQTGGATTTAQINTQTAVTVGGNTVDLLTSPSTGSAEANVGPTAYFSSPSGLLLDAATGIASVATSGSDVQDPYFAVTYDIVPA